MAKAPTPQLDAAPISVITLAQSDGTLYNAGGGTGGTSSADGSGFILGTSSLTPVGGIVASSLGVVADGNTAAFRMSGTTRDLFTEIADGTGSSAMDNVNHALRVNVVTGGAGGGAVTGSVWIANGSTSLGAFVTGSVWLANTATITGSVVGSVWVGNVVSVVASIAGTPNVYATGSLNILGTVTSSVSGTPNVFVSGSLAGNVVASISGTPSFVAIQAVGRTPTQVAIQTAAIGSVAIANGITGHTLRLTNISLVANGEVAMAFLDGLSYISGSMSVATYGGFAAQGTWDSPVFMTATASNPISIALGASINVGGFATYYVV